MKSHSHSLKPCTIPSSACLYAEVVNAEILNFACRSFGTSTLPSDTALEYACPGKRAGGSFATLCTARSAVRRPSATVAARALQLHISKRRTGHSQHFQRASTHPTVTACLQPAS